MEWFAKPLSKISFDAFGVREKQYGMVETGESGYQPLLY